MSSNGSVAIGADSIAWAPKRRTRCRVIVWAALCWCCRGGKRWKVLT